MRGRSGVLLVAMFCSSALGCSFDWDSVEPKANASSGSGGQGGSGCAVPASALDGSCYFALTDSPRSHDDASAACGQSVAGAHLAQFASAASQADVLGASGLAPQGSDFWFSLACPAGDTTCAATSSWTWPDGTPPSFSDWSSGAPTLGVGCATLHLAAGTFVWVDAPCSTKLPAICQVD